MRGSEAEALAEEGRKARSRLAGSATRGDHDDLLRVKKDVAADV